MPKGSETGDGRPCSLRGAGSGEVLQRDLAGTFRVSPVNSVFAAGRGFAKLNGQRSIKVTFEERRARPISAAWILGTQANQAN